MSTTTTQSPTTTTTTTIPATTSKIPTSQIQNQSTAISSTSSVSQPTADSSGNESTDVPKAIIVGALVSLVIVVIIVVFVVIRMKRRKTSDAEHPLACNIEGQTDSMETEIDNDITIGGDTTGSKVDPKSDPPHNSQDRPVAFFTPEAEFAEDEDDHVYENREEVFSVFRRSVPHLDSVQTYLVDRLASHQLYPEFKKIDVILEGEPRKVGRMAGNVNKNRFPTVFPYDSNRVVLEDGYRNGLSNDYVNASYIKGLKSDKEYIAAQGPMNTTAGDFWRMVWQEKTSDIVMLTNIKEGGKEKCFKYWPEESADTTYGPITVTSSRVECRDNAFIRTFMIKKKGSRETREVTQYHYVSWPDHGVPTTVSLVRFWRDVTRRRQAKQASSPPTPMVVHCSAGVGRTGTFIGLDLAMLSAVKDGEIDLVRLVTSLREQRCLMVQTTGQFLFLHSALLEGFTSRDYVYHVDTFSSVFSKQVDPLTPHTRLDNEFKMLMEMRSLAPEPSHCTASEPDNVSKNRNQNSLPVEEHLVCLTENAPGRNQFINAVFMPTFRSSRGSIASQLPLSDTVVDFWRLVYGNDVTTVVSLSSSEEEQEVLTLCKYWPREKEDKMTTGLYTVKCLSVSRMTDHLKSYSLTLNKTDMKTSRLVTLLHYDGWTGKTGGKAGDLLHLIDTLMMLQSAHTSPPYVVQCLDGVQKSGLFCALCDVINRMTYDYIVDVYMTVRNVQSVTPNAVTSEAQFRYLYEAVQERCHEINFGVYANEGAIVTSFNDRLYANQV
ncbi:receptor-type tyrosine-protein phosphatase epsilon-like [Littorina saxatilis]|uniref:protein-tyrosine-phosphatase n=1 Tax=Littorina saxatilis TaxID=31220 RepID=A0AAN9FYN4_9CAEN